LLCNRRYRSLQVGKPHDLASKQVEEDYQLPSPFQQTQRFLHVGSGGYRGIALWHASLLTYFFVRTSHSLSIVKSSWLGKLLQEDSMSFAVPEPVAAYLAAEE